MSPRSQTTRVFIYKMHTFKRKPALLSTPLKGLRDLAPASPVDPCGWGSLSHSSFSNTTGIFSWLCASTW